MIQYILSALILLFLHYKQAIDSFCDAYDNECRDLGPFAAVLDNIRGDPEDGKTWSLPITENIPVDQVEEWEVINISGKYLCTEPFILISFANHSLFSLNYS